jgi:hypothetical protein
MRRGITARHLIVSVLGAVDPVRAFCITQLELACGRREGYPQPVLGGLGSLRPGFRESAADSPV